MVEQVLWDLAGASPSPAPTPERLLAFPVNNAGVDGRYSDGSVVLRVGAGAHPVGGFTGGGTGNKTLMGVKGFNALALGSLLSLAYTWTSVVGPVGPTWLPPGAASPVIPFVNLVVDFNPAGPSDIRVLVVTDSGLGAAISAAIGTYTNNGSNLITHAWSAAQAVLIVNAPPNPVPGGVPPLVSVGPSWLQNAYSFAALVAANPTAILVDAFTADGGMPAGAVTPAVLLVSGDSGNVARSGKRVFSFLVNGGSVL
jgi:hypothetical protein